MVNAPGGAGGGGGDGGDGGGGDGDGGGVGDGDRAPPLRGFRPLREWRDERGTSAVGRATPRSY